MAAPYSAMTVAKWFIEWAETEPEEEGTISNLKLQKLLYYAQGHYLASGGEPLFDDRIEAWSHGPVVPSVYRRFRDFGAGDIRLPDDDPFRWDQVDPETTKFLIEVWNTYGQFAAWRLRNMTHDESPWRDSFRPDEDHLVIDQASIRSYFEQLSSDA